MLICKDVASPPYNIHTHTHIHIHMQDETMHNNPPSQRHKRTFTGVIAPWHTSTFITTLPTTCNNTLHSIHMRTLGSTSLLNVPKPNPHHDAQTTRPPLPSNPAPTSKRKKEADVDDTCSSPEPKIARGRGKVIGGRSRLGPISSSQQ